MLQFNYQGHDYYLPLLKSATNILLLEQGSLQLNLVFEVLLPDIQDLYMDTPLIETEENPLVSLELEINYTDYNLREEELVARGNVPYPNSLQDLEQLSLSNPILETSTLYLPGYAQPCTLEHLQFGNISQQQIDVYYYANASDNNGLLEFEVKVEQIPFQIKG